MKTIYLAPFNVAETDREVMDKGHTLGFHLDTPNWNLHVAGLGADDHLAIQAHGNDTLLLCSAETATWNPRAYIGPHQLWALINPVLPLVCRTIIIHACDSIPFGRFFKRYAGGRDVWAFEGTLKSERWLADPTRNPFTLCT